MHLSLVTSRRVRLRARLLIRTPSAYRLIVCVVMVACFVLPPQLSSVDDGNEDSAPPVIAVVTRTSAFNSLRKGQEQAGELSRMWTPRILADKGAGTVEFNLGAQEGRSILKSLHLLRC